MFNFFKKNDLPANDFSHLKTDIHSHLIPGIDDGAKTPEDAIELIRGMHELGFKKLITTPHVYQEYYPNTRDSILRGCEQMQKLIKKEGIPVEFSAAAEYYLEDHFETLLKNKELLTLYDNYVLIEMSSFSPPPKLYDYIFDIRTKGYKPVLAHPERYSFCAGDFDKFYRLKERGCLFQVNLSSVAGYYDKSVKNTALKLLKNQLVDFLGTDLHHSRHLEALNKSVRKKKLSKLIFNQTFLNSEI